MVGRGVGEEHVVSVRRRQIVRLVCFFSEPVDDIVVTIQNQLKKKVNEIFWSMNLVKLFLESFTIWLVTNAHTVGYYLTVSLKIMFSMPAFLFRWLKPSSTTVTLYFYTNESNDTSFDSYVRHRAF